MLRPTKVFFLWCRNQFIEWQPSLLLCKGKEYHFLLMHKVPPPPISDNGIHTNFGVADGIYFDSKYYEQTNKYVTPAYETQHTKS